MNSELYTSSPQEIYDVHVDSFGSFCLLSFLNYLSQGLLTCMGILTKVDGVVWLLWVPKNMWDIYNLSPIRLVWAPWTQCRMCWRLLSACGLHQSSPMTGRELESGDPSCSQLDSLSCRVVVPLLLSPLLFSLGRSPVGGNMVGNTSFHIPMSALVSSVEHWNSNGTVQPILYGLYEPEAQMRTFYLHLNPDKTEIGLVMREELTELGYGKKLCKFVMVRRVGWTDIESVTGILWPPFGTFLRRNIPSKCLWNWILNCMAASLLIV